MKVVPLPPSAPVLMEATRAIGYSLETALADIIDNSITANATKIEIKFFPIDSPYIITIDNGIGMNLEELINAMRYGSKNPLESRSVNDLGRFGLGLKTASMSQCRKLTVISIKDGNKVGAQWDLDFIAYTEDWSLKVLDDEEIGKYPHIQELAAFGSGTIILWQELDRLKAGELNFEDNMGKYMDRVREHLSLVFHRYLSGEPGLKKIQMSINKILLESFDPFLLGKSTQVIDEESITIDGQKVLVRPYILPHISMLTASEIKKLGGKEGLRKLQGFYVYRNKRLLVWGTWFRMMRQGELSKLARVKVDIPNSLDYLWTLDIKKSIAVPPEAVRKNLVPIIEKLAGFSKRTWTYRGKKETEDTKIRVWNRMKTPNGGIIYEINRDYPLVEVIREMGESKKKAIEQLLVQIERSLPLNQLYIDLIEIILLSRNDPETGLRVFKSIEHYGLSISRAAFLAGSNPFIYMEAFNASLFLSANPDDVRAAVSNGLPAAQVYPTEFIDDEKELELRIAFDFDGIIADDSSEGIYQKLGMQGFHENEKKKANEAMPHGPLIKFFKEVSRLQHREWEKKQKDNLYIPRIRVAIATARNAPAHERVVTTLRSLGIRIDEAFFLGGIDKGRVLKIFRPHIFFDDQVGHIEGVSSISPSAHVPFGEINIV